MQIFYVTVLKHLETCQSGRMCIFAKDVEASKPLEGSNPSVSAIDS